MTTHDTFAPSKILVERLLLSLFARLRASQSSPTPPAIYLHQHSFNNLLNFPNALQRIGMRILGKHEQTAVI
jgi:hypothetical protein